jgi:hypothetical protein
MLECAILLEGVVLESWHVRKLDTRFLVARALCATGGAIGLLVGVQLALASWPFSGIASGLLGAVGAFCLVLGALLFLRLSRAGWGLLVLGVVACLLQVLFNAINLNDSFWSVFGTFVLLLGFGAVLFVHPVRALIYDETVGLWNKAERQTVFWEAFCEFHKKRCAAVVLDISSTGCGVGTESFIPVGERVYLSGVFGELRGEVIREFALEKAGTDLHPMYQHFYGVRFLKRLRSIELTRFRREAEFRAPHLKATVP